MLLRSCRIPSQPKVKWSNQAISVKKQLNVLIGHGVFVSSLKHFNKHMGNAYVRVCWCLISGRYKSIDTFRFSIKIDSNRSKSSIIYRLISKIDGSRTVELL